jgi:hypothetical protein
MTEITLQPGQALPAYLVTYKATKVAGGTIYTPPNGGQAVFIKEITQQPIAPSPTPTPIQPVPSWDYIRTVTPPKIIPMETQQTITSKVVETETVAPSPEPVPSEPTILKAGFPTWGWILIAGLALAMLSKKKEENKNVRK